MASLRGAGVGTIDGRRVARVALGAVGVAAAVLTVILFVAGADKNAQITSLRTRGVPVEVTVTSCMGLLGGSGSNAAGYACQGTYVVGGHRYRQAIPGDVLRRPGSTVRGVTVPDDPELLSTARDVAGEHASWRVFIAPTVLALVLVAGGAALAVGRLRRRARPA